MENLTLTGYLLAILATFWAVQISKYLAAAIDKELASISKVALSTLGSLASLAILGVQKDAVLVLATAAGASVIHKLWRLVTIFTMKLLVTSSRRV